MHFFVPSSSTRFLLEKTSFQKWLKTGLGTQGAAKRGKKNEMSHLMGGPGGMRRAPGRDLGRGQDLGRSLCDQSSTPARGAADRFAHSAGLSHLTCGVFGCIPVFLVGVCL